MLTLFVRRTRRLRSVSNPKQPSSSHSHMDRPMASGKHPRRSRPQQQAEARPCSCRRDIRYQVLSPPPATGGTVPFGTRRSTIHAFPSSLRRMVRASTTRAQYDHQQKARTAVPRLTYLKPRPILRILLSVIPFNTEIDSANGQRLLRPVRQTHCGSNLWCHHGAGDTRK